MFRLLFLCSFFVIQVRNQSETSFYFVPFRFVPVHDAVRVFAPTQKTVWYAVPY